MKKLYTLSFALIASFGFAQVYIPFSGTGALNANGWTTHSGTTGQMQTLTTPSDSGSSLSYPGLAPSSDGRTSLVAGNSEDVNYPLSSPLTTGPVYYSALIKVLDDAQLELNTNAIGNYGLALTSVASASTTAFQARIYLKQGSVPGTFVLGVLNNSGGTAAPSYSSTDLNINTTHLVVVKYDFTTNTASLFINPTPGGAEPAAAATNATGTTAAPTQIAGFVIREVGSVTVGSGNVEVDEIKVNSTWELVTGTTMRTNQNAIAGLRVYPNPVTNGTLFIETSANGEKTVAVFDVLGKKVLSTSTSDNSVNVGSLNAGVYIVQITEEGKTSSRKLVIR